VGIAAHIARLRAVVGHELLLLPSVSVLPVDEEGRVLAVAAHGSSGVNRPSPSVTPRRNLNRAKSSRSESGP
jgi:hypothetical protein